MRSRAWNTWNSLPLPLRVATVLLGVAFVALSAVFVLKWAPQWLATPGLKGKNKAEEIGRARTGVLAALAGLIAVAGAIFTGLSYRLNRAGQITERFTRAIDQIGSVELDVRLGGIYALERIARDSADDHPQIIEVLTAYVREHGPWPPRGSEAMAPAVADHRIEAVRALERIAAGLSVDTNVNPAQVPAPATPAELQTDPPTIAADVQAALSVLGRRDASQDRPNGYLDLTHADLGGSNLTEANLQGAHLTKANLQYTALKRANLQDTRLDEADLQHADLSGANLKNVSGFEADLRSADLFLANLQDADLSGANLQGASLIGANLKGADLSGANVQGAGLTGANLEGACLSGARGSTPALSRANLQHADLSGANLQGADLDEANLQGADLSGANLLGASLIGTNLEDADLSGANLQGADFREANLQDASLSGANLQGADLDEARLQGASYDAATTWPTELSADERGAHRTGEADDDADPVPSA